MFPHRPAVISSSDKKLLKKKNVRTLRRVINVMTFKPWFYFIFVEIRTEVIRKQTFLTLLLFFL